jgi:hypothetical protein
MWSFACFELFQQRFLSERAQRYRMNRCILALSVDDAGCGAEEMRDLSSGLVSRWFFGTVRSRRTGTPVSSLLADALFVALVMMNMVIVLNGRRKIQTLQPILTSFDQQSLSRIQLENLASFFRLFPILASIRRSAFHQVIQVGLSGSSLGLVSNLRTIIIH